MIELPALLLGLCGLAVVCGGLLAIGAFLLLRFTGQNFMSLFGMFGNRQRDDDVSAPGYIARSRPNLQEIAARNDFDAALGQQQALNTFNSPAAPPPPNVAPLPPDVSGLPPYEPRLKRQRDFGDSELYGGGLDPDGDGEY